MLKKIPSGMYFKCENAVSRNATSTLVKFLAALGIKAAHDEMMYGKIRAFFSGKTIKMKLNGQPITYLQGVSYNVDPVIIPIVDPDSDS